MKITVSSIISCLPPLIIAVVVCVATPSFAMTSTSDRGESMRLQLGQLHDNLKLTGQQESLWMRAEAASRDKRKLRQAGRQQTIGEVKAVLNDPQADLRALSAKMDARREVAAQESREVRELWLSFYDSLDAKQREMVRHFLLERIAFMEKSMGRMRSMKPDGQEPEAPHDMGMEQ